MKNHKQTLKSYKSYIKRVVKILKAEFEEAVDREEEMQANKDEARMLFYSGVRHGYYCALETLRLQAKVAFLLPLKELGLEDEIPV